MLKCIVLFKPVVRMPVWFIEITFVLEVDMPHMKAWITRHT